MNYRAAETAMLWIAIVSWSAVVVAAMLITRTPG